MMCKDVTRKIAQRCNEENSLFLVTPLHYLRSFTEHATELARGMPVPYSTNRSLSNKIRKDIRCSTVLDHNILPEKRTFV